MYLNGRDSTNSQASMIEDDISDDDGDAPTPPPKPDRLSLISSASTDNSEIVSESEHTGEINLPKVPKLTMKNKSSSFITCFETALSLPKFKGMQPKTPSESRTIMTDMVLPSETNPLNNLFGGELLARMDRAASIAADHY